MTKRCVLVLLTACLAVGVLAGPNYDPSKIGKYELEDPLTFADGKRMADPSEWPRRRQEILDTFAREMYGLCPSRPDAMRLETLDEKVDCAGLSVRSRIRQHLRVGDVERHLDWTLWRPRHATSPVPIVVMMNYRGAHEMTFDPDVPPSGGWQDNDLARGITNHVAVVASRGAMCSPDSISTVPLQSLHARGYAFLTACYADVSPDPCEGPDHEELQRTLAFTGLFDLWGARDAARKDNTGSLMAWAWALSRGMDIVERDSALDARRVVVTGCSRLGKAALIAGAYDERFAVVAPLQTGGGGVPLAKRNWGENVDTEVHMFSHWYCPAYAKYASDPARLLTFDQHLLCAAVAPRGLLVLGFNARWFDPEGEYLSLRAANPAWRFLGRGGMRDVPNPPDFSTTAVGDGLGYVRRSEGHGHCGYDWKWILDFADSEFTRDRPVCDGVRASSFGWNATDATECLQKALDSGARRVLVDRQKGDWITRPLMVTNSNVEIVLYDGVVVRAKRGEFHGAGDCLLKITGGVTNVTLRGEGMATLAMNKRDYLDPVCGYAFSEWRHAVSILSADGVTVSNLAIRSSGGDGVYVNGARNVMLADLRCDDHNRQGMSPISVSGMTVRRCAFTGTFGAPPQSGIDMEPNRADNVFTDVVYEDCAFEGNRAHGIDMHFGMFTSATRPVSIVYRRCRIRDNGGCGITFLAGSASQLSQGNGVGGSIRFEDCRIENNAGEPLKVMNYCEGGVGLVFSECRFDARGTKAESAVLLSNSQLLRDFGGIRFEDCVVLVDDRQKVMAFEAQRGIGIGGNIEGRLEVERAGKRSPFDLEAFVKAHTPQPECVTRFRSPLVDFREIAPVKSSSRLQGVRTPGIRTSFVYVQTVPSAGEYPIRFNSYTLRKVAQGSVCGVAQVFDRAGTDLGKFDIPAGEFTYVLKANGENVYRLEVSPRNTGIISVSSTTPGGSLLANKPVDLFHGKDVRFNFYVPSGAAEVLVNISPDEPVSARLIDASGRLADEMPLQSGGKVLQGRVADSAQGGTWTLHFTQIVEDCRFQLGGDATPLIATETASVISDVRTK